MSEELPYIEVAVLTLVSNYGVDLDLSGPRIGRTVKNGARELLRKGYLTGTMKALSVTVRGDTALSRPDRQT